MIGRTLVGERTVNRCSTLLLWSALALSAVAGGCNYDKVEKSYANYDDAVSAGIVGNGRWIPTFLPKSARRIRELHNVDTNYSFLRFELDLLEADELTDSLERIKSAAVTLPDGTRAPGWWPAHLVRGSVQPTANLEFYDYSHLVQAPAFKATYAAYLALERDSETAYYWAFESEFIWRGVHGVAPSNSAMQTDRPSASR